jgi:hypothetical protein
LLCNGTTCIVDFSTKWDWEFCSIKYPAHAHSVYTTVDIPNSLPTNAKELEILPAWRQIRVLLERATALKAIHYLHPSIIILSYLAPLTYQKATRRIEVPSRRSHRIRWTALGLMFLLALSYTMEAILFLYRSATQRDGGHHNTVFFM